MALTEPVVSCRTAMPPASTGYSVSYTHLDVYKRQIVESQPVVGGNSVRATGGMNAGKTVYQDEMCIRDSCQWHQFVKRRV